MPAACKNLPPMTKNVSGRWDNRYIDQTATPRRFLRGRAKERVSDQIIRHALMTTKSIFI